MRYVVDLHSHSGYAGGVGNISLENVADTMVKKGINAFGVGDCLQPAWRESLEKKFVEKEPGLFALQGTAGDRASARFVLQTEIIITSPVSSGGRKITHTVLLFPDFRSVDKAIEYLLGWDVKVGIGRPFIKCEDAADVAEKCSALADIDPTVMIIPAHVLMPQGIYGSDNPVDSIADVYGQFSPRITAVETGLSADPELLAMLPELDTRTLVSNSDCHSGALNRVGREFTVLDVSEISYAGIATAIREGKILYTAEFNPAEGRYFLTGHKAGLDRHGKDYCYFSPDQTPTDGLCPICGKALTIGVLERILELSKIQSVDGKGRLPDQVTPRQKALRLAPLVEVLAAGLGVRSVSSKKILALFDKIIAKVGTEAELWELSPQDIERDFSAVLPPNVLNAVLAVRNGNFSFQPGFDGTYGELKLNEDIGWFGHSQVKRY